MKKRSDSPKKIYEKLIGLGEQSVRKNYFPQLQQRLDLLERFRALLDHTSDVILLAGFPSHRIIDANASATRQLGYSFEELQRMTLDQVVDMGRIGWAEHQESSGIEQGNMATVLLRRDGGEIPAEVSLSMDDFGGTTYVVAVARDISERRRVEEALRLSDRMKTEFISTAAHEFRTPLTTILGFSQLLLTEPALSEKERREFLTYIQDKAQALSRIVSDLLDISRVESGQGLSLQKVASSPEALMEQLEPFLRLNACDHHFRLRITDPKAPVTVDQAKIAQVFENLVSNAIKYSPERSTVTIAGRRLGEHYEFSVIDQGVGMTPVQLEHVFDKFYRGDFSNTAAGGIGLGMSIVRSIIEAHGGQIKVESAPGRGTAVRFTLPLTLGEENRGRQ